jgi:cobalt-zinc-cadmium efflux system protein
VNVGRNLWKVAKVFLQRAPEDFDVAGFHRKVEEMSDVKGLHHLHSWSLDGESHVITMHIVLDPQVSRERIREVKGSVSELLSDYKFQHVTIEIELENEDCCSSEGE